MDAEIENLEIGKVFCTEEAHFSGGLRGFKVNDGWALVPMPSAGQTQALVFATSEEHAHFAAECGSRFIGSCIKYRSPNSHVPIDIWESGARDQKSGLHAADAWSAVAYRAREAGDVVYADCASYVSLCLRTAGLRLRDVSNGYHDQLRWALLERRRTGTWFSNAALLDLYADFHSLVSELCSARDHLARLAGIHVGAEDVDSLASLGRWASKPANVSAKRLPLVGILLVEASTKQNPGWLWRLGEIRNEFLHRVPMGRNKHASGLALQEIETRYGPVRTIRLAQRFSEASLESQPVDPLIELSALSTNFEHICSAAWRLAKYPANPPALNQVEQGSERKHGSEK